jgi:hypothetical protein
MEQNLMRYQAGPIEFDQGKTTDLAEIIADPRNSLILLSSK